MSIDRRKVISIVLIVVLTFLLVSQISSSSEFTETDPVDDSRINRIIWESIALPEYMDPHKNYESAGWWIQTNIYETLFTYDFDSADTTPSVPLLAESVDISDEGLSYTFSLRQDVTFHDGTEFNASAVQMNFWRMLGRGWDDGWGPVWMIAEPILGGQAVKDAVNEFGDFSTEHLDAWFNWKEYSNAVTLIDHYTVRIRLAYPFTPFLAILARPVCSMISPTYFMTHGGMSPGISIDNSFMEENACGTGPYKLEQWIQDDRIELTLFDDYWRADDAKNIHPNAGFITDVTIKLNTDANSRLSNLHAGTIDAAYWPVTKVYDIWNNVTDIGDGTLQSLSPYIKVWIGQPNFNVMFLGFNMHQYLNVSNNLVQNPFTNYELRAAISWAFNYQAIIDTVYKGLGMQLQGPVPQDLFGHDDDLFMFTQNLDEAVVHWNFAMDAGLDAILANNSYELYIYHNDNAISREVVGLSLKQAIENIIADPASTDPSSPLTINVSGLDWASYLYRVRNNQLPIFPFGWTPDYADPNNYAAPIVKSALTIPSRIGLDGSLGYGGVPWDSATVDGWINDAAVETDPATRILLYTQIQEAIVDHCAYLWCYQGVDFHVERNEMNGYVYNPMRQSYFFHYHKALNTPIMNIPIEVWILPAVYLGITVIAVVILVKSSKS